MAQLDIRRKLEILADAAKYDASCASSGTAKRDSRGGRGIGSPDQPPEAGRAAGRGGSAERSGFARS